MIEWSCPICAQAVPYGETPCPHCGRTIEWEGSEADPRPSEAAHVTPRRTARAIVANQNGPSLGLAIVSLLLNFAILPGLGSALAGRAIGLLQMLLAVGGIVLAFGADGPGPVAFGILLWFTAWVGGLVTGTTAINSAARRVASAAATV